VGLVTAVPAAVCAHLPFQFGGGGLRNREQPLLNFSYEFHCVFAFVFEVQPIAFGVSFLHSQISIDDLVLHVSFTTFR